MLLDSWFKVVFNVDILFFVLFVLLINFWMFVRLFEFLLFILFFVVVNLLLIFFILLLVFFKFVFSLFVCLFIYSFLILLLVGCVGEYIFEIFFIFKILLVSLFKVWSEFVLFNLLFDWMINVFGEEKLGGKCFFIMLIFIFDLYLLFILNKLL